MIETSANIYGIFVGFNGDQLEHFNAITALFPPEPGSSGWIAIGWPALGSLDIYKGDLPRYNIAYERAYPYPEKEGQTSQAYALRKNQAWRFAHETRVGDAIIAPCSGSNLVLVGEIIGPYASNFSNELGLSENRWIDLVHLRPVRWNHVIVRGDARYSAINRIGQLTFSKVKMTVSELNAILG
jgi:predicted Mrr-cat superfamily restriction endonuclease